MDVLQQLYEMWANQTHTDKPEIKNIWCKIMQQVSEQTSEPVNDKIGDQLFDLMRACQSHHQYIAKCFRIVNRVLSIPLPQAHACVWEFTGLPPIGSRNPKII